MSIALLTWAAALTVQAGTARAESDSASRTNFRKPLYGSLHVEQTRRRLFTQKPGAQCGATKQDVTAYCNDDLCILWERTPQKPVPEDKRMLAALNVLDTYIHQAASVTGYQPTVTPESTFVGTDGKTRGWSIETPDKLCPGYGGASFNGEAGNAIGKGYFRELYDTALDTKPTVPFVYFYEIGRSFWNVAVLDNNLEWQLEGAKEDEDDFWTVGFNGALGVIFPGVIGTGFDYEGQSLAKFRKSKLDTLDIYMSDRNLNFNNTWTTSILPWTRHTDHKQSIDDLMSGVVIYMYDHFGGLEFMRRFYQELYRQPSTPSRLDRAARARNFVRAAKAAYQGSLDIEKFFRRDLKWSSVLDT